MTPLQWLPGKPDAPGTYWMEGETYPVRIDAEATGELTVRRPHANPVPLAKCEARFSERLPDRPAGREGVV